MKPEKLSWVTIPLLISAVLNILGMLGLPFIGLFLNIIFGVVLNDSSTSASDTQTLGLVRFFTGSTLWIIFFCLLVWTVLQYLTYRAMQSGKSWARIAAAVIAILGLLNFPLGTALGVFMLVGVFDPGVQQYASR